MQLMINFRYFPASPKRLGDRCCLGDCMLRYPDSISFTGRYSQTMPFRSSTHVEVLRLTHCS